MCLELALSVHRLGSLGQVRCWGLRGSDLPPFAAFVRWLLSHSAQQPLLLMAPCRHLDKLARLLIRDGSSNEAPERTCPSVVIQEKYKDWENQRVAGSTFTK